MPVANRGRIRKIPLLELFPLLVPLSLHGLCGSAVLLCPGGGPPSVGHGGRTLTSPGCAVDTIGFGVGLRVGLGVAFGVGRVVGRAVGVGVLAGLGAGVGLAVGALVGGAAGRWLAVGPCVPTGTTFGAGDAAPVGDGIGGPGGVDGDGATDPTGWPEPPVAPGPSLGVAPLVDPGAGVVTTATGPCPDPSDRCWSPTPPMPIAIVARTRFRTPRLRTRRAR